MSLILLLLAVAPPTCTPDITGTTWSNGKTVWQCNGSTWVSYTADAGGVPVLQAGPFSVSCTNCSAGAGSAQWTVVDGGYVNVLNFPARWETIDGGYVAISNLPANLLTDGGVVNVGNFPSMWPNLQWVSIDGGITASVAFPANLLTDGGVVNVGNFPATQAVSIASMPSTPVTGTFWPANLLADGGVVNIGNTVTVTTLPATPWACGVTISTPGNTLTCQAAPGVGSLYLTDYAIFGGNDAGTALTAGKAAIVWGTGTNCATLDGGIVPTISGAGTALQIPFQANGGTSTIANLTTPIIAPSQTQLCVHCSTWCTGQLSGYTK